MEEWIQLILNIIVGTIILAPILWLVGRALVGREKAKFTDALWIMFLGQVIGGLLGWAFGFVALGLIGSIIAFIIQLLIWLFLIHHFFDTSWGKAFIIAIIAVIVSAIVFGIIFLVLLGLGFVLAFF